MKRLSLILALVFMLGTLALCLGSCADKNTEDTTASSSTAADTTPDTSPDTTPNTTPDSSTGGTSDASVSIIGAWIDPNPMSSGLDELWVFEEDAKTFHLYQITKDTCKVQNTIDGTYELKENGEIVITMMGYPLTYTLSFEDNDTMVLSDHGTSSSYKRFVGTIIY